ncbi:GNAT domain [Dillenia turbinata]|uniref:GNAT domain n=1 Tax=Dillenia turbinata TaxID=194707 RepID=A0AAN8UDY5_9MAGN
MSPKIAAESLPGEEAQGRGASGEVAKKAEVVVREYNEEGDKEAVVEMERRCELDMGKKKKKKPSLVTDLMGDPVARVRHCSIYVMLVAEDVKEGEIVGVIRGSVKTVTSGKDKALGDDFDDIPHYVKLAYVLGLRVSPTHRRCGVGTKLVQKLEEWCKHTGAEYMYMATECTNKASINLFTLKSDYTKFRTPAMLVQPVHAHCKPLSSSIAIATVPAELATSIYRCAFANSDKEVFKLEVKGVSRLTYAFCAGSRVLESCAPWFGLPTIDIFRQFGVYLLYGLYMEGSGASRLMKSLCTFVHNMAKDDDGCGAVVAEVGPADPIRECIPHLKKFSWDEDFWCIKRLTRGVSQDSDTHDWIKMAPSTPVIFVDPRDF